MFRLTRLLFQQVLKTSTGITGLKVHPNPLPALLETYRETLTRLSDIPEVSVYRQGVEALTKRKLSIVERANGDVQAVEKELDEGQIEEAILVAQDELSLVSKMIEWKAYVSFSIYCQKVVSLNLLPFLCKMGTIRREVTARAVGVLRKDF